MASVPREGVSMKSRSYENNLKLLLMRRMAENDLSLEKAMVAYAWFDYYHTLFNGDGKKAFELVRERVMGLDQMPPSQPTPSVRESIKRLLKDWFA